MGEHAKRLRILPQHLTDADERRAKLVAHVGEFGTPPSPPSVPGARVDDRQGCPKK